MMAASAHVEKALLFAASKLVYEILKEEQKEAVRAFVAGNDVFVTHDGHNPAYGYQDLQLHTLCKRTLSCRPSQHCSVSYLVANTTTCAVYSLRSHPAVALT